MKKSTHFSSLVLPLVLGTSILSACGSELSGGVGDPVADDVVDNDHDGDNSGDEGNDHAEAPSGSGGRTSRSDGRNSSGGMGGETESGAGGEPSGGASTDGTSTGGADSESTGGMGGAPDTNAGGSTPTCTDDALCVGSSEGGTVCDGLAPTTCSDLDEDGCLNATISEDECAVGCVAGECVSADSCEDALLVTNTVHLSGADFSADFTSQHLLRGPDCAWTESEESPEAIFVVDLEAGESVRVWQNLSGILGIVEFQSTCGGGEACLDYRALGTPGDVYTATKVERIYAWITPRYERHSNKAYEIIVDKSTCGDGIVESYEECDDQNGIDSDGCSKCKVSYGYECDNSAQPSVCAIYPSLGTFGAGDVIPAYIYNDRLPESGVKRLSITFTEPVWLGGALSAGTSGDPNFAIRTPAMNTVFGSSVRGSDLWHSSLIKPGTYYLFVTAYTTLAGGFSLELLNPPSIDLGVLNPGTGVGADGGTILAGSSSYFKFTLDVAGILSGSVVANNGDPDVTIINAAGTTVLYSEEGGTTEPIRNTALSAGDYFIRVKNFSNSYPVEGHSIALNLAP